MKLYYHPDADSLQIDPSERPSAESLEISQGVVLDYDSTGVLVAIDIDSASKKVDSHRLVLNRLPGNVEELSA